MKIYVIDNGSRYIGELVKLLDGNDVSIVNYGEIDLKSIDNDTLVILSGGHNLPVLWHSDDYQKEIDLIKNHTGPIIGICLGFQLIAHVFGSHLHLLDERRKGNTSIYPTDEGLALLQNRDYFVYENHRWAAREIKKPLVALAGSHDGVELFKHSDRPIYGAQFHPEGIEDVDGDGIFRKIILELTS